MPDTVVVVPEELDPIVIEVYTGLQGTTGAKGDTGAQGPAGLTSVVQADVVYPVSLASDTTLNAQVVAGAVIDGVTLTEGMVVFAPFRGAPYRGFFRVQASGAPIREPSLPNYAAHVGTLVNVKQGTKYGNTIWRWTGPTSGVLGTTDISYDRIREDIDFLMFRDVGIVEATEVLIPEFYYVNGKEGMVLISPSGIAAPNRTRYFTAPLSTAKNIMQRVWYDRAYHLANPSDPQGAIKSENNDTKITTDRFQNPEICTSVFGNVSSRYPFIGDSAGVAANQVMDGQKFLGQFTGNTGNDVVVPTTDATLISLGITQGVKGVGSSYTSFTFVDPLLGGEYFFGRVYVESPDDNTFPTPAFLFRTQTKGDSNDPLYTVSTTLEKQLSPKAAIFSLAGRVSPAGAGSTRVLIGDAKGSLSADFIIGGIQFAIQKNSPVNWLMRNDWARGFNIMPFMGKDLWLNTGRPQPIFLRNMMSRFTMEDYFYGALSSTNVAMNNYPYSMQGDDTLRIDPSLMGTTAQLALMSYTSYQHRYIMDLDVHIAAASGLTGSPKILMIGDIFSNRLLPFYIDTKIKAMGLTPTWLGTVVSSGSSTSDTNASGVIVGEFREGRGWGDLSGLVADGDTPAPFALGTEATYNALSKTNKFGQNPFLRLATGGDSPTYTTAGGYIFDFRHYLDRFGYANPDIVLINLGYDDWLERGTVAEAIADINLIVPFILSNIRAACPGIKIGVWATAWGFGEHNLRYSEDMRSISAAINAAVNNQPWGTFLIPTHIHTNPFAGWAPDTSASFPLDVSSGIRRGPALSRTNVSTSEAILHQTAEPLSAFISNVFSWNPDAVINRHNVLAAGGRMTDTEFLFRNNFFNELRTQNLWQYIDEMWIGTSFDVVAQQTLVSVKKGIVGTAFNGPGYGPTGVGCNSTAHIRTGYIPSVHGTVIAGDNVGLMTYERNTGASASTYALGVYVSETQNLMFNHRTSVNKMFGGLGHVGVAGTPTVPVGETWSGITRAPGSSDRQEWRRGLLFGTSPMGTNGTTLPNIEMYLGGRNNNGTRDTVRNTTLGLAMVVASMSEAQQLALYNAVQNMMTARGVALP